MVSSSSKKLFLYLQDVLPWLTGGLLVLSANWAASAFYETFDVWKSGQLGEPACSRFIYIAVFLMSAIFLYRQKNMIIRPHTRMITPRRKRKMKHLVFFVSPVSQARFHTGGIPYGLNLTNDIIADVKMFDCIKRAECNSEDMPKVLTPPWQWEMILRGIEEHWGEIKTVSFICSEQSLSQIHLLVSLCQRYRQQREIAYYLLSKKTGSNVVELLPGCPIGGDCLGINFEDFDDLSEAVEYLIRDLKKRGAADRDISIDITGGQKPCSAVGASMSFNRDIKAQYVQTGDPWKVISYDVVHITSDTGGLGL